MFKPDSVNILGKHYEIKYCDNPADVDIYKRESLWGQIDFWTRTIRIYDSGRKDGDIADTVFHEVLHGIVTQLDIEIENEETAVRLIGMALSDVFIRNGWLNDRTDTRPAE
jgi:hypothetical protein